MAILEIRAARGWTLARTAQTFLVNPATIAEWTRRIDEQGSLALATLRNPANTFPEFVRYVVQSLKRSIPPWTVGRSPRSWPGPG